MPSEEVWQLTLHASFQTGVGAAGTAKQPHVGGCMHVPGSLPVSELLLQAPKCAKY